MDTPKEITLLIEGHGNEILGIPSNLTRDTKLLSFPCDVGSFGLLQLVDNQSLEILVLNYLISAYSSNAQQSKIFNSHALPNDLKQIYKRAKIEYPGGGFCRNIPPKNERTFFFAPNNHENCRSCVTDKEGNIRCLPVRNPNNRYCPVYGLIVVASNDPDDAPFTLASLHSKLNDVNKNNVQFLNSSNLHQNNSSKMYWKNKLTDQSTINKFDYMINQNEVTLTNLVSIFQNMGYSKIYILDPSCRDTSSSSPPTSPSAVVTVAPPVASAVAPPVAPVASAVAPVAPVAPVASAPVAHTMNLNSDSLTVDQNNIWTSACKIGTQCWENMFRKSKIDGGKRSKKQKRYNTKRKKHRTKRKKYITIRNRKQTRKFI